MAVRTVFATITIGGATVPVIGCVVNQSGKRTASTFNAGVALSSFPGGDAFFRGLSANDVTISVNGSTLFEGEADAIDIEYDATTVTIRGRDHSAKLHETKNSEKFTNKTRAEIVKEIAQRNGLTAQITSSMKAGKTFQIDYVKLTDAISDATLLHKIAELDGVAWRVKGKTLEYGDPQGGSLTAIFVPPSGGMPATGNVLQLHVSWNLQAAKKTKVTVQSWNTKKKKALTGEKEVSGFSGNQTYKYRIPGLEQDQADDFAKNKLKEHTRHEISVHCEMPGDTSVDPSMKLNLQGNAFAQSYEIDTVCHRIAMHGYTMSITAKSAKDGRS